MSEKNDIKVNIGGTEYNLRGYESESYLQKVASYINNKMKEYEKLVATNRMSREELSVILHLNIADDFFKAKRQIDSLEDDLSTREKDICNLKHELIASQIKYETCDKKLNEISKENIEFAKKIVELETKLKIH